MPDSYTPNLQLTLVEVGASRDTWGAKLNANTTTLDSFVGMAMPIGAILDFAGPQAPAGYLICDGRLISRTTYSALFAVIGTYWGAGDGSTTFALPNMAGRSAIGPGTITDQGGNNGSFGFTVTGGFIWNVIGQTHLPNYAMWTNTTGTHNHTGPTTAAGAHYHTTDAQGYHHHGGATTGDSPYHTHSGTTDVQGDHSHTVPNTFNGGPGGLAPGGFSFGGNSTTSTNGAHAHSFTTGIVNQAHTHGIYADGNHAHTTTWVGDHQHYIQWEGDHTHYVYLGGSGTPFEVMGPIIVVTKIIYAGQQAVVRAVGAVAPAGLMIEGFAEEPEDELAAIREELAQLRALLGNPLRRRMLSAPLRGPH